MPLVWIGKLETRQTVSLKKGDKNESSNLQYQK